MSLEILETLGWSPAWAARLELSETPDATPARVACVHRDRLDLLTAMGPMSGEMSGRLRNAIRRSDEWPAVGDWVAATPSPDGSLAIVHSVLDRASSLSRRAANTSDVQMVAANLDRVVVVTSATPEFNVRRVERFLSIVWEGGATPAVALTKVDAPELDVDECVAQLEAVSIGVPVFAVSPIRGDGMAEFEASFAPAMTTAFVGSSGVGKSTLLNAIAGEERVETGATRSVDGKGRHTTTRRELFVLGARGVIIDTPGLRGLALIDADDGVGDVFSDVEALAAECRFNDCGHETEPGCAVQLAIADGRLAADRLASYRKLLRELERERARTDPLLRKEREERWRKISRASRKSLKAKGKA